jgi:hypothetical protein
VLEDRRIRFEFDDGPPVFGGPDLAYAVLGFAAAVFLFINGAVPSNFGAQVGAQGVDTRHTDPVQSPRNFVGVLIKFSTGMKDGHNDFQGGAFFFGVQIGGDTAAVVLDPDPVAFQDTDLNQVAMTGQGFIDRVIDDFVYQVVQAFDPDVPDVHGRPFADGFQSLEDLDIFG